MSKSLLLISHVVFSGQKNTDRPTASHNDFWSEAARAFVELGEPHEGECLYQDAYNVALEVSPAQATVLTDLCANHGWSCQRSDVMDGNAAQWLGSANNWGRHDKVQSH